MIYKSGVICWRFLMRFLIAFLFFFSSLCSANSNGSTATVFASVTVANNNVFEIKQLGDFILKKRLTDLKKTTVISPTSSDNGLGPVFSMEGMPTYSLVNISVSESVKIRNNKNKNELVYGDKIKIFRDNKEIGSDGEFMIDKVNNKNIFSLGMTINKTKEKYTNGNYEGEIEIQISY